MALLFVKGLHGVTEIQGYDSSVVERFGSRHFWSLQRYFGRLENKDTKTVITVVNHATECQLGEPISLL